MDTKSEELTAQQRVHFTCSKELILSCLREIMAYLDRAFKSEVFWCVGHSLIYLLVLIEGQGLHETI